MGFSYMRWESKGFTTEQQIIPVLHFCLGVQHVRMTAEAQQLGVFIHIVQKSIKIRMMLHINLWPVIEPGPLQMLVVHTEPQGMDQVELHLGRTTKPSDIAGVGRNLRLI